MTRLCATFALCVATSPALAQDSAVTVAIDAALALCTDIPDQTVQAREILSADGWQNSELSALIALSNAGVGQNFRAGDLDHTFTNAFFMAASILGNSALGDDQVSMSVGDHHLGVLGIAEDRPYCVLSGSSDLFDDFFARGETFHPLTMQSSDVLSQATGIIDDRLIVTFARIEPGALDDLLTTSNISAERREEMLTYFHPASVQITPLEVFQ